jgi:hypothetical protein
MKLKALLLAAVLALALVLTMGAGIASAAERAGEATAAGAAGQPRTEQAAATTPKPPTGALPFVVVGLIILALLTPSGHHGHHDCHGHHHW